MLQRLRGALLGANKTLYNGLPARPWEGKFEPAATKEDIFFCFRLILGRLPNREEWAGHSSRAGEPLPNVVKTYANSEEFKARGLLEANMPLGVTSNDNGRFIVFANGDDPVLGAPALTGQYEPSVAAATESLLQPGDYFLDVGANLGYFSLLAAKLVGKSGHVYSVEPNDLNVKLLESSRRANGFTNISIFQVGASNQVETLFLHAAEGNGSTTIPRANDSLFGTRTIPGIPLDNLLVFREKPIKLIKIDVEGFEYNALMGAHRILTEDRPNIIFEFQGSGLQGIGGPEFLRWLAQYGYSFVNISTGRAVTETQSVDEIMQEYYDAMVDHIDVLAKR